MTLPYTLQAQKQTLGDSSHHNFKSSTRRVAKRSHPLARRQIEEGQTHTTDMKFRRAVVCSDDSSECDETDLEESLSEDEQSQPALRTRNARVLNTSAHGSRAVDSDTTDPGIDSVVEIQARMVLEVLEEASRNLKHPFNLSDKEGEGFLMYDACMRLLKTMSYLAPATSSERWSASTKDLLVTVCDARIRKVNAQEKAAVRSTANCIVCGQKERNCGFVLDLATAKDPSAYVADDFLSTPDVWPEAFNTFLEAQEQPSVLRDGLPREFLGSFAVGTTCLKRFRQSFSAQNFVLDPLRTSWEHITSLQRDPGYKRYPTCTQQRVDAFCRQLDIIKTAAAVDSETVYLVNNADGDLWKRVDEALLKKANGDPMQTLRIAGDLACRSLQRVSGLQTPAVETVSAPASSSCLRKSPRLVEKQMDNAAREAFEESQVEEAIRRSLHKRKRSEEGSTSSEPAPVSEAVGRGSILPVVEKAGGLRAPERLGSYQRTASDLFTLAADLTRSGESDRAAAASAGGIVVLELLQKLHTSRVV